MGFQELCLLCYETLGVRHSEAVRVALTYLLILPFSATDTYATNLGTTYHAELVELWRLVEEAPVG